ncbi:MAG TPA: hypothetical protein P5318_19845, partial [Candidatus Hydrogenedentes bacterium]|nr:hypothetical protein [Candidatus Hydrogenedentota bacterium]
ATNVATGYGFAPTSSVQTIATAAVASASATPYTITYGATNILIDPANGYWQWLSATNAVTLNFPATATGAVQAIALDILPAASITWSTSNLNLGTVTMTTGNVQTVLFRSAAGTNGWVARK